MRYKPKGIAALHIALGGVPPKYRGIGKHCWRTSEGNVVARECTCPTTRTSFVRSARLHKDRIILGSVRRRSPLVGSRP